MNFKHSIFLLAGFALLAAPAFAVDMAPTNFSSVIFNGTITSATGGANSAGTISSLFASNGIDYTLTPSGTLTDPVAFTYTKTSATTGRINEAAVGTLPAVSVELTFTTATSGTFVATYGNSSSQLGSFSLVPVAFSSPLLNVSTRTTLAANGSAITGFIIGGSGPRRVLIRAVGPGIARFGVASPLANPTLSLWRDGTLIGANDDYSTGTNVDTTLSQLFATVGAFPLTLGSRDAALAVELEPGSYTALIRGSTATETGEVLLEVYFLN